MNIAVAWVGAIWYPSAVSYVKEFACTIDFQIFYRRSESRPLVSLRTKLLGTTHKSPGMEAIDAG